MKKIKFIIPIFVIIYLCYMFSEAKNPNLSYYHLSKEQEEIMICVKKDDYYCYYLTNIENDIIYESFNLLSEKSNSLPIEYHTHLPLSTKLLDYDCYNNKLILNVSKEFLNYDQKNDLNIIREIFFTYYEQGFDYVYIKVDGQLLDHIGKYNILNGIDKSIGINNQIDGNKNTKQIILYYYTDNIIYPVTFLIDKEINTVDFIIKEMLSYYYLGDLNDIVINNDSIYIDTTYYDSYAEKALEHSLNKNYLEGLSFYLS